MAWYSSHNFPASMHINIPEKERLVLPHRCPPKSEENWLLPVLNTLKWKLTFKDYFNILRHQIWTCLHARNCLDVKIMCNVKILHDNIHKKRHDFATKLAIFSLYGMLVCAVTVFATPRNITGLICGTKSWFLNDRIHFHLRIAC